MSDNGCAAVWNHRLQGPEAVPGAFRHGAMTASGSYSCVDEKTAIGGQLRAHPLLELVVVIN